MQGVGGEAAPHRGALATVLVVLASLCVALLSPSCGTPANNPRANTARIRQMEALCGKWAALGEGEQLDGYVRKGEEIYCGDTGCSAPPLHGVDIASFEVLVGSHYARDKYRVYYPFERACVDGPECSACYCTRYLVEGADPGSLAYLGKDYASDARRGYFRGEALEGSDGPTMRVVDGPRGFYFAVDKRNVYHKWRIFNGADPATFYFDREDPRTIDTEFESVYIVGDKDREWEFIPPDKAREVPKD